MTFALISLGVDSWLLGANVITFLLQVDRALEGSFGGPALQAAQLPTLLRSESLISTREVPHPGGSRAAGTQHVLY